MANKVTSGRYRWIINCTIAAVVIMVIYAFLGSFLVSFISSGRLQILFLSSGVYNSYGFLLTPLYAFAFWLIVILGIYTAAITGRKGDLLKLTPLYILTASLATLASVGIVVVKDGITVEQFSKGVPFQFSEFRIVYLFQTRMFILFQWSYFLLDILFWFIFFVCIVLFFKHLEKRGTSHDNKVFHRVSLK